MVAGGAGFVGSQLVRDLLADGARVAVLDSFLHGRRDHVEELDGEIELFITDILDEFRLLNAFATFRPEFVFHLIGDTYVPTAYEIPKRFFKINLEGTINILMASQMYDVERVLYVSSTEVYGEARNVPMDEEHVLRPDNTYAVSKLAADRLCYTFHLEHDIPVIIARIYNCYGPRATEPYVIPEIITQLARGPVVHLGNVKARRDFTYVSDTTRGLMMAMRSNLPNGEAVNIGTNRVYQISDLVDVVARQMDRPDYHIEIDEGRLRRKDIDIFQCNYERLRKATGWEPTIGIEAGIERTVDWFRQNNSRWAWEEWTDGRVLFDATV